MKFEEIIVTGATVALGEDVLASIVPAGMAGSAIEIAGAYYGAKHTEKKGTVVKGILYGVGLLGVISGIKAILGNTGAVAGANDIGATL